jgi:hypothetical protein
MEFLCLQDYPNQGIPLNRERSVVTENTTLAAASPVESKALSEKFAHWIALYGAYLFLAGWSYLDYYLEVFGINSRWLELGANDTIARGFTVLFGVGAWLSGIYIAVLVISLVVEVFLKKRNRVVEAVAAMCLVLFLIPTFFVAKKAGIDQANTDRGAKTTLPTITFVQKLCAYRGKLVYVKGELFYIYNLANLPGGTIADKARSCPIDLDGGADSAAVPQLWLVRGNDLSDVRIIHYEKEAKP